MMGGIGSGKSFIAKLFKYPVFNADQEVNNVYRENIKQGGNLVELRGIEPLTSTLPV